MSPRRILQALALCAGLMTSGSQAALISVGSVPELNPSPSISIPAGTFLVPVQISGASNLQNCFFPSPAGALWVPDIHR